MDGVVEIIPRNPPYPPVSAAISSPSASANTAAVQIGPNIVVASHNGSIELQWPISASDYMLGATTNLSQPFTMFGYTEMTNIETGIIYVTVPIRRHKCFFDCESLQTLPPLVCEEKFLCIYETETPPLPRARIERQ